VTGLDENSYAKDFTGARGAFLDACAAVGLEPTAHPHPLQGPNGEALATDVVRIGPERAARLLVIISGVHGVELYCGSACQVRLLREGHFRDLPADTAVLLIHALNPWGAAHNTRTTEGNVDLCRNFLDFDAPLPQAPVYEKVAHAFAGSAGAAGAGEILREFTEKHGVPAFLAAVMGGQYAHPDGFSFGGHERVWSNGVLTEVLQTHGAGAERVLGIDIHSGLGPYGHGTLVSMQTGAQLASVRKSFGEPVEAPRDRPPDLPGEFYVTTGHCADGFADALPGVDAMMVTAEFGTYSAERNLAALVDSHWLNVHGDAGDKGADAIRQEMRDTHAPDDPEWRDAVWTRLLQMLRQASRCLQDD
jgi:hypothetical protein